MVKPSSRGRLTDKDAMSDAVGENPVESRKGGILELLVWLCHIHRAGEANFFV